MIMKKPHANFHIFLSVIKLGHYMFPKTLSGKKKKIKVKDLDKKMLNCQVTK